MFEYKKMSEICIFCPLLSHSLKSHLKAQWNQGIVWSEQVAINFITLTVCDKATERGFYEQEKKVFLQLN